MSRKRKGIRNIKYILIFTTAKLLVGFWSRQVFIHYLGSELLGFNATLNNILGFLNLAELGVGAAISIALYKALFNNNRSEIIDIISIFGFLYRRIGWSIFGIGVIVSCFLPWIFKNQPIHLGYIYFGFYGYLFSSLLGYFYNYKQTILDADQKSFVLTSVNYTISIMKSVIQIVALRFFLLGYVAYILVEFVFAIINMICISWSIRTYYPWLNASYRQGKKVLKKYTNITTLIKKIYSQKFAGFIFIQTDNIIIYIVTNSLILVAYYSNYALIIISLNSVIATSLGILQSSVGNLIAEGNKDKIKKVFWQMQVLCFIIASVVAICLVYLINPFVNLWLGKGFILPYSIVGLMIINVFVDLLRFPIGLFLFGYGLVRDTWAPWTEAVINLSVSLIAGIYWGIAGVLLGTLMSMLFLTIWKSYFLYQSGFNESVWLYWKRIFKYLIIVAITFAALYFVIIPALQLRYDNFLYWSMNAVMIVISTVIILSTLMYISDEYMKYLIFEAVMDFKKLLKRNI